MYTVQCTALNLHSQVEIPTRFHQISLATVSVTRNQYKSTTSTTNDYKLMS